MEKMSFEVQEEYVIKYLHILINFLKKYIGMECNPPFIFN